MFFESNIGENRLKENEDTGIMSGKKRIEGVDFVKRMISLLTLLLALVLPVVAVETNAVTIDSGTCGDSLNWVLDSSGTLTISGTGAIEPYSQSKSAPWAKYGSTIRKVVLEEGVTKIGDYAFATCSALETAILPETLFRVGKSAFYQYQPGSGSDYVTMPFFTSIQQTARQWSQVLVEKDNAYFPNWDAVSFVNEDSIVNSGKAGEQVYWELDQDGVMTFFGTGQMYSFGTTASPWYDLAAKTLHIEEGIESIGDCLFEVLPGDRIGKTLETVKIASSIKTVGEQAFTNCLALKNIHFLGSAPQIAAGSFNNVTATAWYPAGDSSWTNVVMQNYGGSLTWEEADTRTLVRIKVSTQPTKRSYIQNEEALDVTGGKLTLHYDDGSTEIMDMTEAVVTGFDNTVAGNQRLTVTYKNCKTTITVTVRSTSGTWGDNLFWAVDSAGTLTISGSGEMTHYLDVDWQDPSNPRLDGYPWHDLADRITAVTVKEGVTSLEEYAVHCLASLRTVNLPDSLCTIGPAAFASCPMLERVEIPENVAAIAGAAFYGDTGLKEVLFTGDAPEFDEGAFAGVSITGYYPGGNETWTPDKLQGYGGTVTWVPTGEGSGENPDDDSVQRNWFWDKIREPGSYLWGTATYYRIMEALQ